MKSAHDEFSSILKVGAAQFGDTSLSHDLSPVARRVRRARVARATTASVASVGVVGALAFGASELAHRNGTIAPATEAPSPSVSSSPSQSPAPAPTSVVSVSVDVASGPRIDTVIKDLARALGVTEDEARAALVAALPPEAGGNPEGWVAPGEYTFNRGDDLSAAANSLVGIQVSRLETSGLPRDEWLNTLIIASIIEQETPGLNDMPKTARVIQNRLDADMALQLETPLLYITHADEQLVGDDGFNVDSPYNTFMYKGLPPGAIGAPSEQALLAALSPAEGDWLYFIRDPKTGETFFSETFEEHAANVDRIHPGTGASD